MKIPAHSAAAGLAAKINTHLFLPLSIPDSLHLQLLNLIVLIGYE